LIAGMLRLVIAVGGGWLVVALTGSLVGAFAVLALALVVYGITIVSAIASGSWFRRPGVASAR
jgi:MATE family, multidrug efflux pump